MSAASPRSRQSSAMNVLIIKLGATGDVVRTTALLRCFKATVVWITAAKNKVLLEGLAENLRPLSWEQRDAARGIKYDLVINLEDEREMGAYAKRLQFKQVFGAYLDEQNRLRYT